MKTEPCPNCGSVDLWMVENEDRGTIGSRETVGFRQECFCGIAGPWADYYPTGSNGRRLAYLRIVRKREDKAKGEATRLWNNFVKRVAA